MCGSNDLLKQDGVFVCQSCGTKYSVEEAKKMMVEGTVEVSGTVKVDQSHLIENFLDMARSAIASGNHTEAEQYCNKVIEIDPNNYKALLYKGTATAWQSTFANIRILETINCWQKASANCKKENRTEFLSYTDAEFRKIVIAMVNLAGSFVENGINEYKGSSYREHLLSILKCVELYTKAINSTFRGDRLCSEAAISVVPCLKKCAQSEERLYHKIKPSSGESYSDFIKEYLGCIDLLNMTATFGQKSAAKALCYQTAAEVMETINDLPFYIWSDGRYIPHQNPRKSYGSTIAEYRSKAAEARAKIEAEKSEEYWQDHPDEYKAYLKKQEEEKRKKEEAERINRERAIKEENEKKSAKEEFWASHNKESQELNAELRELEQKKSDLNDKKYCEPLLKLIKKRIDAIQALLASDRRGKNDFSEAERGIVTGRESFNLRYNELLSDANSKITKAAKKRNRFLLFGGLILFAIVTFLIVLNSYIIPHSKYTSAIEKMNSGNTAEAYALFNEVKSFKDAQYHMDTMLKSNPMLALSASQPGDVFEFGHYEQDGNVSNGKEAIEWYVLSKEGNKVLLISKYILDASKSSEMNKWINDFNQSAFSSAEKECGNAVLLNIYDANRYASELSQDVKSIVETSPTAQAKANGIKNHYNYISGKSTGYSWWLSGSSNGRYDLIVYANSTYVPSPNGTVNSASDGDVCGLRPCVWIELE